jgi:predicted transcriptional regulator
VYRAIFPRETARSMAMRDMAERLFDGSLSDMVKYLLSQEKLSPKERVSVRGVARKALKR